MFHLISSASCRRFAIAALLLSAVQVSSGMKAQTPATQDIRDIKLKPATDKPAEQKKSTTATIERPELILQTGHSSKVEAIAFSPDGRYLASGSADTTIKLWDAGLGHELRTLSGHSGGVKAVVFSPDGRLLASGGNDGKVRLWDISTGREMMALPGHASRINALAFSPDGRTLASGGADNLIKLWETKNGRELRTLTGHYGWVLALAFSPDGQSLASGSADKTAMLWDVAAGRALSTLTEHTNRIKAVAFSPDGETLASGGDDQTVMLWKTPKGRLRRALPGRSGPFLALAFSADGARLIACAADRTIKQFDVAARRETGVIVDRAGLEKYEVAVFSPDGSHLATCNGSRTIELRRVASGGQSRTLASYANAIKSIAFSPDGRWFAIGHQDTSVTLWDTLSGRAVATLSGRTGSVTALVFSPDSRWLVCGSLGGAIKIWDVERGGEARSWNAHAEGVNALLFTPDGAELISGSVDHTIKIWEPATGRELARLTGHTKDVNALSLTPDGKCLASAGADGVIKLWDLANKREARTLKGHTDRVFAVAFSPDGQQLASGGADRAVKLWETATGRETRAFTGNDGVIYSLVFDREGKGLAAGGAGGAVKLWETDTGGERATLSGHSGAVNSLRLSHDGRHLVSGSEDGSARLWETATEGPDYLLAATIVSLRESADWLVVTPDGLFDGSPAAWSNILWRFAGGAYNVAPVEIFFNEFYYPDVLAEVFAGKKPRAARDISQRDRRQPRVKMAIADEPNAANRAITVKLEVAEAPQDQNHATGSGVHDVRLFRNGSLVKVWRGDSLQGRGSSVTLEYALPLVAGENRLTAYAFNRDNVKSADETQTVIGAESLQRRGALYILAVGINQYANADYNLKYAVADATTFSDELSRRQTRIGRFARVEVVTLFDEAATKANLVAALERLSGGASPALPPGAPASLEKLKQAQPEDIVVVYFAGHGAAHQSRFYLIPHDLGYQNKRDELDEAGLRQVLAHSVSDAELELLFEGVDAGQVLFVLDACNSGQALEAEDKRPGPLNLKGLAQLAYEKGMNILTAAQSYQAALETARLGHGLLTYALVEDGIKKMSADTRPRDGEVLLREWLDYAADEVPRMPEAKLRAERGRGLRLKHVQQPDAQRPRVFYRREAEAQQMVVAKPE